jgi:hypothetical protein
MDPQLDKARTLKLMKKRGAVKAELEFYGGHDEGNVNSITLYDKAGIQTGLEVWYCGGYSMRDVDGGGWEYVPLSVPQDESEELSDLLQGPINERFGSWGGVESTSGVLTWEIDSGLFQEGIGWKMNFTQDEPTDYEVEG